MKNPPIKATAGPQSLRASCGGHDLIATSVRPRFPPTSPGSSSRSMVERSTPSSAVLAANDNLFQPSALRQGNPDRIQNLAVGSTVDTSQWFSSGYGGSQDPWARPSLLAGKATSASERATEHSWMLVFTGNTSGRRWSRTGPMTMPVARSWWAASSRARPRGRPARDPVARHR